MNGHHADCSCQSCTIGREIGMDRALELIREMREALVSCSSAMQPHHVCVRAANKAASEASALLSEHAEHE